MWLLLAGGTVIGSCEPVLAGSRDTGNKRTKSVSLFELINAEHCEVDYRSAQMN